MPDAYAQATMLVTGFEPFGSHNVNPSAVLAESIDGTTIAGYRVVGRVLPVSCSRAPDALEVAIERHQPAVVLSLGLAAGRAMLALERVAINVLDFSTPDNDGLQPGDKPVVESAPAAYFATVPLKAIVDGWREAGIPGYLSNTAGTYVCNQVLYSALHLAARHGHRAGFIHLPFLPAQAAAEKPATPSMTLDLMLEGVRSALELSARAVEAASPWTQPVSAATRR